MQKISRNEQTQMNNPRATLVSQEDYGDNEPRMNNSYII